MSNLLVRALPCTLYIGAAGMHTSALFRYDPDDPLVVSLQFRDGPRWFAREMLVSGMHTGAGNDYVVIAPVGDELEVIFRAEHGPGVTVAFAYNAVLGCLQETYQMVRLGKERIHVPSDLSGLEPTS